MDNRKLWRNKHKSRFGFLNNLVVGVITQIKKAVSKLSLKQPFFVVQEGLEPSQAEPESEVLPLHHWTIP